MAYFVVPRHRAAHNQVPSTIASNLLQDLRNTVVKETMAPGTVPPEKIGTMVADHLGGLRMPADFVFVSDA